VRAGRQDEFARTYDEHVREIYGFFGYRVGSRSEAEDLTQATFERALRAWGRFDPRRASAKTWLFSIARNLLIDHHRRERGKRELRGTEPRDVETRSGAYELDERGLGPSPELEAALAGLADRERELIALRFGGGLTAAQISRLVGLSPGNVDQILSRTLRALRDRLEPQESAGEPPPEREAGGLIRRRMVRRRRGR
jgi:RNA polymerase sigma-70 factor, ECF subfamily